MIYLFFLFLFGGFATVYNESECKKINDPFVLFFNKLNLFNIYYLIFFGYCDMLGFLYSLECCKKCPRIEIADKIRICYVSFFFGLFRLMDPREYFWRINNFILKNLIFYSFKVGVLLAWFTKIIIEIASLEQSDICEQNFLLLVFIVVAIIGLSFKYYYIELFSPEGLEEAQKELEENKVEEFKEIEEKSIEIVNKPKLRRYLILSKSQFNFIPQFGRFARISLLGSGSCFAGKKCPSVDLEHILYDHNEFERPNGDRRCIYYCLCAKDFLVGFHQTSREAALKISLSPMRITQDGMFGDGVYFAR